MPRSTITRVREAVAGDAAAVRELIDELTPVIHTRVARALVRQRSAAGRRSIHQEVEDLTQQVYLALFSDGARALLAWDEARGLSLPNFVGLLAEREVASILRRQRRSPWTEEPTPLEDLDRRAPEVDGPELSLLSRELFTMLVERLRATLSDRGLELFHWIIVDERTVDEVCTLASLSTDAVYAWRSRLLKQARLAATEILSESDSPRRKLPARDGG